MVCVSGSVSFRKYEEEYQDVKQQLSGSEQLRAEEIIQEYEQEFLKQHSLQTIIKLFDSI